MADIKLNQANSAGKNKLNAKDLIKPLRSVLISYFYTDMDGTVGFGNQTFAMDSKEIFSSSIPEIEKSLSQMKKYNGVAIINIIDLAIHPDERMPDPRKVKQASDKKKSITGKDKAATETKKK